MKLKSWSTALAFVFITVQWPGYFYSFMLTDNTGNLITTNNHNYKMTIISPNKTGVILNLLMCGDSATIRFYAGGNHGLEGTHSLQIQNINTKERMIIQFPSSLSGGKDKYYRNLFAGNLNFKKGAYEIKLPATGSAWDNLEEKHFCPDYGGNDSYWDISYLQQQ